MQLPHIYAELKQEVNPLDKILRVEEKMSDRPVSVPYLRDVCSGYLIKIVLGTPEEPAHATYMRNKAVTGKH